jgi:general secretion pathway protein G
VILMAKKLIRNVLYRHPTSRQAGMSLLELIISCSLLLILSSMALPIARNTIVREKEKRLRQNLREIRDAIDRYKELTDQRKLRPGIGKYGYPPDLETLVKGVPLGDARSEGKSIRFLRRIPEDPMTGRADWGLRAAEDEKGSASWSGKDVFDIYSKSAGTAADGSKYSDW